MTDLASASVGLETSVALAETTDSGITKKKLPFGTYLAGAWMIVLIVAVLGASYLPISDPNQSIPGLQEVAPFQVDGHPFGGDSNGRDLLARTIYGARVSMEVSVAAVLFGLFIGGALGLLSGYYRGRVGDILVSLFDILLAFPPLVLALALVAVLKGDPASGKGLPTVLILILALGIVTVPILARISRANTLAWAQRDFVTAARSQGAKNSRIILREILPNVLPTTLVLFTLIVANNILVEAALSFLGVGVSVLTPSWGNIIQQGYTTIVTAPWQTIAPGIAIMITAVSLNVLGDGLRDALDPHGRLRGAL